MNPTPKSLDWVSGVRRNEEKVLLWSSWAFSMAPGYVHVCVKWAGVILLYNLNEPV